METDQPKSVTSPVQVVKNFILYSIWLLLQFMYEYSTIFYDGAKQFWKNLKMYIVYWDYKKQIVDLHEKIKKFQKVPKHLAISVQIDESSMFGHKDKLGLVQNIARTVSFAYAANIRMISLYDSKGLLKTLQSKLNRSIQKEITRTKLILETENSKVDSNIVKELPLVKIHNANGNMKEWQSDNDNSKDFLGDTMNLFIFSREDGKPVVIECVKDIYREHYKDKPENDRMKPNVTEKMLDSYINRYTYGGVLDKIKVSSEPDLLMVFGNIKSTTGFLPWHIRLSEIHWMPSIHKADFTDFLASLAKFSGCQQRFGK